MPDVQSARYFVVRLFLVALVSCVPSASRLWGDNQPRAAWTTSRVKGSPELPLPLSLEPAFPSLKFKDPMHVRWQADIERYFVCELGGKVWSFPDDPGVAAADLAVDLKQSLKSFDAERSSGVDSLYSLVFDPDFAQNRFVYMCFILKSKTSEPLSDGSRISRFRVTTDTPPRIDVESELPLITWLAGGHNGCDLAFDNSGCLLFSTGDATAPSPPDSLATGQDISDLLSSVLRIDVRGATREQPYVIPSDNPFREHTGARPEVWALGFRNPWRLSVDPVTSQLWLGDVGWEKWELIHRVERGGNYGWSVREGAELIQPDARLGPGPILAPRVALPHADAASITGGFVYRGDRLSEIKGEYIFGDWITGRIWSVPMDDDSPHREIASGQLRIIAFSPDRDGEPLVVNHLADTTLFRLVRNPEYEQQLAESRSFPRQLSQTGLFEDVAEHRLARGVRAFAINQPQWNDGAVAEHAIALPDLTQVTVFNEALPVGAIAMFNSRLHYPAGTVLVKTLSLPGERIKDIQNQNQNGKLTRHRIETQLLHFDGRLWRGTSYQWNADQSDAELVPSEGRELTLPVDGGQRWRIHSRTECSQCHNPWPETTLAFTPEQLHQPSAGENSEWLKLADEGYLVTLDRQRKPIEPERCVRRALSQSTGDRRAMEPSEIASHARSYLHANCAHCHQNGAGAAVDLSLKITDEGKALKAIDVPPSKGNFGLTSAKVIAPGHAIDSTLVYRMATSSIGRMPHIGSREVDFQGVVLVADWIDQLPPLDSQDKGSTAAVQPTSPTRAPANAKQLRERANDLIKQLKAPNADVSKDSTGINIAQLRRQAVALAINVARAKSHEANAQATDSPIPHDSIAALAAATDPIVSSLFEAHLPPRQRQRRLGPGATFADLVDISGNRAAGEKLFFDTARMQCSKCHRIGAQGVQVGPDLSDVGKRLSPAQIFESLADPDRVIDPKYQSHTVVLEEGKVFSGLLSDESPEQVVLSNAQGERLTIAVAEIESRRRDTKSLMPAGLTGELTAQQAADLIAYLSNLK